MGTEQYRPFTETHVLALPLPFQGHINPMLQFSKRLASKGLKVTLLSFIDKQITRTKHGSVNIEFISSDGNKEDDYFQNLKSIVSIKLPEIVARNGESGYPVSCLLYDSVMPWALDIARELGLFGACLFTQSCAVSTIYYKAHEGALSTPVEKVPVSIEGMPLLDLYDLPSFFFDLENYPTVLTLLGNQFLNTGDADWVFFNTFCELEDEVINGMIARKFPIKPIGPSIPSMFLDKRIQDNKDYGLNLHKPNIENYMKWLDSNETCSVIYVSFGSLCIMGEKQMEEIAFGLKRSNHYFLWVVRESEEEKLPSNFVEETMEKGMIVTWCNQLEVLAHKSTGCFMTHCGWNSTMEALSLGVPMVAMPQWCDQTTNAKFVADVWRTGVRVKVDEEGIVTKEEIEMCLKEVMEGEIRKNCEKWKKLAKEAMDEDGSSDKNVEEFVAKLMPTSQ
ncbi:hypothetical protein JCGZ_10662 [Jatropha curcas]|uniref:Glycosyltransferase n=1 Tax=Jatropha curcas TaxID=180498 RepID=A0A067KJE1_JATCU|nr:hypothetical protein JCGZ_10662 [Jatropha curcas]